MMQTATEISRQLWERDARFHALALSAVAKALRKHGPIDPERAEREAHDIAIDAVVNVLASVYTDDAEISALRMERDAYKEQALKFATLGPLPPIIIPSS
jgi:hypothetical protein